MQRSSQNAKGKTSIRELQSSRNGRSNECERLALREKGKKDAFQKSKKAVDIKKIGIRVKGIKLKSRIKLSAALEDVGSTLREVLLAGTVLVIVVPTL